MLGCPLEDAVSTSHTPLSPLSGCLGRRYPHYTERKPAKDRVFTLFTHGGYSLFIFSCLNKHIKQTEAVTCLVFAVPKFLMYMSYSLTGGRSKMENVSEKSRSIKRRSSALRFLQSEKVHMEHKIKQQLHCDQNPYPIIEATCLK